MTTTPAAGPGAPADDTTTLRLSRLLKRPVADSRGESIGRLADVIVRLRGGRLPARHRSGSWVGGREIFVPIGQLSSFGGDPLRLSSARLSLGHFDRRDGAEWVLAAVDTRRPRRLLGLLAPQDWGETAAFRDWHDFEWLIGHAGSARLRGPFRPHPSAEAGPDRRSAGERL